MSDQSKNENHQQSPPSPPPQSKNENHQQSPPSPLPQSNLPSVDPVKTMSYRQDGKDKES